MPALESLSEEPTDLLSAFTNAEHTTLASAMSTMYPLPSTHTQRLCGIVLYLVMDQRTLRDELCQTMKALDEVLLHRDIPEYIRRLLQPQVSCPIAYLAFHELYSIPQAFTNIVYRTFTCIHAQAHVFAYALYT